MVAALAVVLAACGSPSPGGTRASATPKATTSLIRNDNRLAEELLQAVRAQKFGDVVDTTPPSGVPRGKIHQPPNLDLAVIELSSTGQALAAADVLFSPKYPAGVAVPMDQNLTAGTVRWRYFDEQQWDAHAGQGTKDVLAGRQNAPIDFMTPYPASVQKLMVGFAVLRLVDQGRLTLDDTYRYTAPTFRDRCGGPETKTVRRFFDEMITISSNESTCALIQLLVDRKALDRDFAALGMPTLHEVPGLTGSNMSSLDTAKLLMIVNGGPGTYWTAPDGKPVGKAVLSDSSRAFFLSELGNQGLNQVLSTTNWCGREYPAPGIPQRTPSRWINPSTGKMDNVGGRDFGRDVRPCNETAEVTFAHKTGLVARAGGDAGIVHSLPGKPGRHYIVVVLSNLGSRFVDADRPADPPGTQPVEYTEKYGRLGRAIDQLVTSHRNP